MSGRAQSGSPGHHGVPVSPGHAQPAQGRGQSQPAAAATGPAGNTAHGELSIQPRLRAGLSSHRACRWAQLPKKTCRSFLSTWFPPKVQNGAGTAGLGTDASAWFVPGFIHPTSSPTVSLPHPESSPPPLLTSFSLPESLHAPEVPNGLPFLMPLLPSPRPELHPALRAGPAPGLLPGPPAGSAS